MSEAGIRASKQNVFYTILPYLMDLRGVSHFIHSIVLKFLLSPLSDGVKQKEIL